MPPNTCTFIPPPPLPEFYLPCEAGDKDANYDKESTSSSSSSSSASEEELQVTTTRTKADAHRKSKRIPVAPKEYTYHPAGCKDRAEIKVTVSRKAPPVPGDATDEREHDLRSMPRQMAGEFFSLNPTPSHAWNGVPSLAVYHICRICLRPRSNRYHNDHPIPCNGAPPPPGICRRCRVKSEHPTEVEFRKESNNIRIGLQCLIPDEEYMSFNEMKDWKRERFINALDKAEDREKLEKSEPSVQENLLTYRHVRVRSRSRSPARQKIPETTTATTFRPKTTITSTAQDAIDEVSESSMELAARTQVISNTTTRSKFEDIESQVRKIAREEVERYQQAERKMEAHGSCYAHGRMVLVEREAPAAEKAPQASDMDVPAPTASRHRPGHITRITVKKTESTAPPSEYRKKESPLSNEKIKVNRTEVPPNGQSSKERESTKCQSSSSTKTSSSYRRFSNRTEPLIPDGSPEIRSGPQRKACSPPTELVQDAMSDRTDQDYWYGDGLVRTASGISSRLEDRESVYRRETTRIEAIPGPPSLSDRMMSSSRPGANTNRHGRSESPPDARNTKNATLPTVQATRGFRDDKSLEQNRNTQRRVQKSPPRESAQSLAKASRGANVDDREYLYTLRTTEPARAPPLKRIVGDDTGWAYKETTEYLRRKRRPAAHDEAGPRRDSHQYQDTVGTGSEVSRVRFARNVEFSPTPPGSDASSTQFRQIGRAGRDQVDGHLSSERGNDLIEEYERIGRARTRATSKESRKYYSKARVEGGCEVWKGEEGSLAHALSESPSRERLGNVSAKESDGTVHSQRSHPTKGVKVHIEDEAEVPRQWNDEDFGEDDVSRIGASRW